MSENKNQYVGVETCIPSVVYEKNLKSSGALLAYIYLYRMCNRTYDISFSVRDIVRYWGQKSRSKTTQLEREIVHFLNDYKEILLVDGKDLCFGEENDDGEIARKLKSQKHEVRLNEKYFSAQSMHKNKIFYKKINHAILYKILHYDEYLSANDLKKEEAVSVKLLLHFYLLYRLNRVERHDGYSVEVKQEIYVTYFNEIAEMLNASVKQVEKIINLLCMLKIIKYKRGKKVCVIDNFTDKMIFKTNKVVIADYKVKNEINEFTGKYDTVSSEEEIEFSMKYMESKE